MRTTQQFSITQPNEMAEIVKTKVAVGEYATGSEVLRDGLRILMARDRAVESWLHQTARRAYDALKADLHELSLLKRCVQGLLLSTKKLRQKSEFVRSHFYASYTADLFKQLGIGF